MVSIDSGPSGLTNDSTPTFTFSSEPGLSFECSLDTGTPSFGPCSGNGSHTAPAPLADGPYTFRVRTADAAGNPGSATQSFTVDTTAPDAPELTTTVPASPANNNSPKIFGSAEAGATVRLFITNDCSGSPIATATAAELGAGITVSVSDDSLTRFRATTTSDIGNPSSCSAALTYVEDSTAPETQIDSSPQALANSAAASFSFSGTDTGGSGVASFQCRIDSAEAAAWAACSSPKSYSGLADGGHKFEVRAIDQAGNTDPTPASFSWTVDTAAPSTAINSNPPALTNSAAASFSFSGTDTGGSGVASFQCRIDSTEAAAWAACSSPKSYSALADGCHKFEVRAIDQAGNTDATPASFTWTVDTTPPVVSIDSGPSGLTNDSTPTFTFSSEPSLSYECSLDTGTPSFGPCSGDGTHTASSPLADGPHTFRVRTADPAGNPGSANQSFTVDTAAPDAPELTATDPASPANDNSPKIFGSAEAGSTVRLFITNDCSGSPIATATAAELGAGITVSVPDDSLTRFRATTTSDIGNPSSCSAAVTFVEDSTAPETQIDSGPQSVSSSAAASFSFSGSDTGGSGVASFQCRIDSTEAAAWAACSSPKSYSALADGSHKFEVRAIDQAGNIDGTPASSTWTVDTTPPVVSIDSGPSGVTNDTTPTFTFSSEPGLAFECSIDTGSANYGPCSGNGTHTPSSPLADGHYTFRVRTADAAGNPGVATRDFTVDSTAPDAPSLTELAPASPADNNSPKIVGSAPAGTTVRLYAGANCSGTPLQTVPASGLATGLTVGVADNSTTSFSATATSGAEVTSSCSNALTYVEDSTAPDTSISDHPPAQSDSGAAEFSFTGSDGSGSGVAAFECRLDSGAWTGCSSPLKYSDLADGTHSFEVRAEDAADNTDSTPAQLEWAIDTTPSTIPDQPAQPTNPGPQSAGEEAQFIRVVRNTKKGTAFLLFEVTGPGHFSTRAAPVREVAPRGRKSDAKSVAKLRQLRLQQRSIKPASISVVGPGEVKVPIKLTGVGRSLLETGQTLKVRINVSFIGLDGSKSTWKLNVKLKKQLNKQEKRMKRARRARKMTCSTFVVSI